MTVAKAIKCSKCGAALELKTERAKTVVCSHCGAQLDLTTPDYAFLADLQRPPVVHPLRVGMKGVFDGVIWEIVAHVRYAQPDCFWDEYALLAEADGKTAWLQYDDATFKWFQPFTPQRVAAITPQSPQMIVDGERDYVLERGQATLERIEGELTWKARIGDKVHWLDGTSFACEISPREVEWYRVHHVTRFSVASAFAMTMPALEEGCYAPLDLSTGNDDDDDDDDDDDVSVAFRSAGRSSPMGCVVLIGGILLLAFFGALSDDCDGDGDGGGGGHYSGSGWSGGK